MKKLISSTLQARIRQAVDLYESGLTTSEVANEIGKSRASVSIYLKKAGVDTSARRYARYSMDTRFFCKVDSHVKAYWLGFLLADGYITRNCRLVAVEIQRRDRDHLVQMATDVLFNGPIADTTRVRNGRTYAASKLSLCSRNLAEDLLMKGWREFKERGETGILQVRESLIPSLIRGLWDGDGSLVMDKGQLSFTFIDAHKEVSERVQKIIRDALGLNTVKVRKATKRGTAWVFRYGGNRQVQRIMRWVDAPNGPRLQRKRRLIV